MLCSLSCAAVLNVVLNFTAPHSHQERFFAFLSVPHLWTANSTITWHYWSSPFGTRIHKSKRKQDDTAIGALSMRQVTEGHGTKREVGFCIDMGSFSMSRSQQVTRLKTIYCAVQPCFQSHDRPWPRSTQNPTSPWWPPSPNLTLVTSLTQPHLGDLPHPTSPWWPPSPSLTLVTSLMTITKNGPFQLALGLTPSHVSAEAGRKHNAALRTVERPRHGLPVKQHGPTTYCLGFPGRPPSWGRWQSRPHTPGCWCTLCQGSSTTSSSNDTFTAQTKHKIILILVWKHLKSCEYTLIIPHRAVQPTTKPH